MSHFTVMVVGDSPDERLKPFEEGPYNARSQWDWYELGGRWSGQILQIREGGKVKVDQPQDDVDDVYDTEAFPDKIAGIDQALRSDIVNFDDIKTHAILYDKQWYDRDEVYLSSPALGDEEWLKKMQRIKSLIAPSELISIYDCHS